MQQKIRIEMTGTSPLLVHNVRLASPLDPFAREMKKISSKRSKTPDDYEALARLEFEGGLYHTAELGPYLTGVHIERSIEEGAKITRNGPGIRRGLFVTDDMCPIVYSGPRDVEGLWAKGFYDQRIVAIQRNKVLRTRPRFPVGWRIAAEGIVDTSVLDLDLLAELADTAGTMSGIGDYRPRFGRYTTQIEVL